MRDYASELEQRVAFIQDILRSAHADGIVFGNSGGKDSALVGILCKMAVANTVGLMMPCETRQNYGTDKTDAECLAKQFDIATRVIDLSDTKYALTQAVAEITSLTDAAISNLAPRLRMTALYAVAASENLLVAGTSNRSERHVGYFTKWGDGGCDFNPIADLTVTEVYEFLTYLEVPDSILQKAPSGGLFEGQTDEAELGISYGNIDRYLLQGAASEEDRARIERYHKTSMHKRKMPPILGE